MLNNLFGVDLENVLNDLWGEEIIKQDGTTELGGAEYSEHIKMLQNNSTKVKLAIRDIVIKINQYILDNMSSKTDLNGVIQDLSNYIKKEKIASTINDSVGKLITVSILKLLKDEMKTDYQSQINVIKDMLEVSDTTLDELREIVAYIKLNREMLNSLHITNMAGYTELDTRIGDIDTLAKDNQTKLESLKTELVYFEFSRCSIDTSNTYYDKYTYNYDTSEYLEYEPFLYTLDDINEAKALDIITVTKNALAFEVKIVKSGTVPYAIRVKSFTKK